MRRRFSNHFAVVIVLGLLLSANAGKVADNGGDGLFELNILHTNDMHSRFDQTDEHSNECQAADVEANRCYGGFGRLVHTVGKFRSNSTAAPVLYLDAGDVFSGTPWFKVHHERIVSAFMNLLQPDAQALGNHEFDLDDDSLLSYVQNARYPILAANLNLTAAPKLAAEKQLRRSVVVDVGQRRIGIVGYLTPTTKYLAPPTNVGFGDEVAAINAEVALLRNSSGVRTIIALGHSGLPTDRRIAAECPGVDIVIGAHDDTFLWNVDMAAPPAEDAERVAGPYPLVVEQPGTGKRVPVVQAYRHTKYVGHLRVRIAADGTVRSFDGQPLLMDGQVPRDPEALALLQRFRPAMREVADRPVGESMVRLDGTCASVETNAGNLVCDALLHANAMAFDAARKAETAAPPNGNETMAAVDRWTDCAVVFFQTSAIAPFGIKAGKLTMGDLMMLLPYDSRFYSVWLSGREILQMLEHSVERYTKHHICLNEFLQMSGARVVYNVSLPAGQRVQQVDLMCTDCELPHYEPLQQFREYKCIVSDHMSHGGDGYAMLLDKRYFNYTDTALEAVEKYLEQKRRVYPAIEGRIRVVGAVETVLISGGKAEEAVAGDLVVPTSSTPMSAAVSLSVMLLVALHLVS